MPPEESPSSVGLISADHTARFGGHDDDVEAATMIAIIIGSTTSPRKIRPNTATWIGRVSPGRRS